MLIDYNTIFKEKFEHLSWREVVEKKNAGQHNLEFLLA